MSHLPLTYTRAAAACPTLGGRTIEAVRDAADGICCGGRDGMISTPPRFS